MVTAEIKCIKFCCKVSILNIFGNCSNCLTADQNQSMNFIVLLVSKTCDPLLAESTNPIIICINSTPSRFQC